MKNTPKYNLYYVPEFPIDRLDRYHRSPEPELTKFIKNLVETSVYSD